MSSELDTLKKTDTSKQPTAPADAGMKDTPSFSSGFVKYLAKRIGFVQNLLSPPSPSADGGGRRAAPSRSPRSRNRRASPRRS